MPLANKKVFFRSFTFFVDQNVYEPAEDSFLFAENLDVDESSRVVDIGVGCGILSIVAAKKAQEVYSVDINPCAIRCARRNAIFNGVAGKIFFVQGDLFSSLARGVEFDSILFNAPYLPSEKEESSLLERSWAGGKTGREIIDRFIDQAPEHLSTKGRILLMQSSLSNVEQTFRRFMDSGLDAKSVASRSLPFFEKIVLIIATRREAVKSVGQEQA
jgi:release factor glutamine methyltransferase